MFLCLISVITFSGINFETDYFSKLSLVLVKDSFKLFKLFLGILSILWYDKAITKGPSVCDGPFPSMSEQEYSMVVYKLSQ